MRQKFLTKFIVYLSMLFLILVVISSGVIHIGKALDSDIIRNTAYLNFQEGGHTKIIASNQVEIAVSRTNDRENTENNSAETTNQTENVKNNSSGTKDIESSDKTQNAKKTPVANQIVTQNTSQDTSQKKMSSGAPPKLEKNLTTLLIILIPMALTEILIIIWLVRRRIQY